LTDSTPNEQHEDADQNWVAIAQLLRPQGRRGELLAEPLSDLPDIFSAGRSVWLADSGVSTASAFTPSASNQPLTLEAQWSPTGKNAGRIVLKLSGCDSIDAAEALAGKQLLITTSDLPALETGTFFVGDLIGCELYDGDKLAGKVVDVQFAMTPDGRTRLEDAAPLLAIEPPTHGEAAAGDRDIDGSVLVPFVQAWLTSVDLASKRIHMRLPAGFFDAPDEPET
jgi:16S rRNA processing protein RimM